jgi:hypothetical protein
VSACFPHLSFVIPAKAGTQDGGPGARGSWAPTFVGVTREGNHHILVVIAPLAAAAMRNAEAGLAVTAVRRLEKPAG